MSGLGRLLRFALLAGLCLTLRPAPASCSLDLALAALVDHAADRPVDVSSFRGDFWPHGMDFRCWNGCPYVGSQNTAPVAEAAAGNFVWMAALARAERQQGLLGSEIGSPTTYFAVAVEARMVALRDARRADRPDLVDDLRQELRAIWTWDALIAVETPRTSSWADLGGRIVQGAGDAGGFLGVTPAVAGNRWNGKEGGDRWLNHDAHADYLTWALDWVPRRPVQEGVLRDRRRGRGSVVAWIAGVDRYDQPAAPEPFGLTAAERAVLVRVVRGDAAAAREAVQWIAPYGTRPAWSFRLRRTVRGAEAVFFGPAPNPNKPAHAATSISTAGEWRSLNPSRWQGVVRTRVDGYAVRIEDGWIIASVDPRAGSEVRMPELAGDLLWDVTVRGPDVTLAAAQPPAYPPAYPPAPAPPVRAPGRQGGTRGGPP